MRADLVSLLLEPVALGVVVGLVVGKQIGITLAAYAVVRLGLGSLPEGVTWRHIYGVAWLGGLGFTILILTVFTTNLFALALLFGAAAFAYAAFSTIANVLPSDLYRSESVASAGLAHSCLHSP